MPSEGANIAEARWPHRQPTLTLCLVVLPVLIGLTGCGSEQRSTPHIFELDARLLEAGGEPFIAHSGAGRFDNYLAMNLPFSPAEVLFLAVQKAFGESLQNRGEAHVTVVTPVEYQRMAEHLSIDALNQLAGDSIQSLPFDVICLGRASAQLPGGIGHTYFLVLDAPALLELRREIQAAYLEAGGSPERFDPVDYAPHVTLGFTARDLHERDGAIKDRRSCIAEVRLKGGQRS